MLLFSLYSAMCAERFEWFKITELVQSHFRFCLFSVVFHVRGRKCQKCGLLQNPHSVSSDLGLEKGGFFFLPACLPRLGSHSFVPEFIRGPENGETPANQADSFTQDSKPGEKKHHHQNTQVQTLWLLFVWMQPWDLSLGCLTLSA